jgi:LacI family transcriptional regulator
MKLTNRTQPLVGIAADGSSGYGRDVVLGITRYSNAQRRWEFYTVTNTTFSNLKWPQCEGAIFAGIDSNTLQLIRSRSKHIVSCSGSSDPTQYPVVSLDDFAVGVSAGSHLLECRLQNFAFYGTLGSPLSDNRLAGFTYEVGRRGFSVVQCPFAFDRGFQHGKLNPWIELTDWLRGLPKPVGVMAIDDVAASYLASACRHAEIGIPEELAIIGVNNDELACESAVIPLSSVEGGFERIGYTAARLLDRLMLGEKLSRDEQLTRLPPLPVVTRLSTDMLAVNEPHVAAALMFIREHACDPCSVEDILRHVPAGRRWLERQFDQKLGRSPGDEIQRIQMETAKRLLIQPALTIPEIALRCGFSSSPTFGRAFLRIVGTTPAAYRRTALMRSV